LVAAAAPVQVLKGEEVVVGTGVRRRDRANSPLIP